MVLEWQELPSIAKVAAIVLMRFFFLNCGEELSKLKLSPPTCSLILAIKLTICELMVKGGVLIILPPHFLENLTAKHDNTGIAVDEAQVLLANLRQWSW